MEAAKLVRVQTLSEDNASEVEALFKRVWIEDAAEYPEEWRRQRALTRDQIAREMHGGYSYFGATIDNKLAGVYKSWLTSFGLFGEHQSVDPAYRKMGLATAMYHHFIEHARKQKCRYVYVNILARHTPSLRMMEKMGFRKLGKEFSQARNMLVQLYCKRV